MMGLVERMLDLHKKLAADRAPTPRRRRRPRIATPQADALVYEFYGLSDDEIAIVEGK